MKLLQKQALTMLNACVRSMVNSVYAVTPRLQRDENVAVLRFGNLLAHYTGDAGIAAMARQAQRAVVDEVVAKRFPAASVLLAQSELDSEPLHVTVVGPRDDERALALYTEAVRIPTAYRWLQWWDPRDGPLKPSAIRFPTLRRPAAFVCAADRCSAPLFESDRLLSRVRMLSRRSP